MSAIAAGAGLWQQSSKHAANLLWAIQDRDFQHGCQQLGRVLGTFPDPRNDRVDV